MMQGIHSAWKKYGPWLLLALLPFLLALGLAAVMEPLVQRVRRRLRVRRSFAAAAVTTLLLLTLGGALAALLDCPVLAGSLQRKEYFPCW